jgi:hypothetical protein
VQVSEVEQAQRLSKAEYQSKWLGVPTFEKSSNVFPYEELKECIKEKVEFCKDLDSVAGYDFGFHQPPALVIQQKDGDCNFIVFNKEYGEMPWSKQLIELQLEIPKHNVTTIYCDSTRPELIADLRVQLPCRVFGVPFKTHKPALQVVASRLVVEKKLMIPASAEKLIREMAVYMSDTNKNDDLVDCYDEKTEVLTLKGWKYFKDVSSKDAVATSNLDTDELEYQYPTKTISYHYSGTMFKINSRSIDLLITPNHKVVAKRSKGANKYGPLELIKISELKNKHFKLKRNCKWIGKQEEYFKLHPFKSRFIYKNNTEKIISMNTWVQFLGLYLSEGNTTNNKVSIAAVVNRKKTFIRTILNQMPFEFKEGKDCFYCYSKQLGNELKPYGLSYEKYIPSYIKDLSSSLIDKYLYAHWIGDGSRNIIYTTSKQMADDLQELVLKTGKACSISLKKQTGKISFIEGKQITAKRDIYEILISTNHIEPRINHHVNKGAYLTTETYTGNVYCLTVPNHTLLVRRNGKASFSGNSLMLSLKEETQVNKQWAFQMNRQNKTDTSKNKTFEFIDRDLQSKDYEDIDEEREN